MFTATEPVRIDHTGVRTGGTLRLRGPGDPLALDPAVLDDESSARLTRLYARQLFTYQPHRNLRSWQAIAPVPDLAAQIPSIYNAGLGASGTTYVVHLRPAVRWDTAVPRPVTAHDVVRGLKRLANPVRPASVLAYLTSTIRGMAGFHADFAAAVGTDPTAAELAEFQNGNEISGVFALDDESLVFELVRPVLDFISMLALPAVAPAPVEYDAFLPDSPELRRNLRSTGPYRVTRYVAGRELVLEPNPVWRQETDPIRRQYLDRIEVGLDGPADPAELSRQIHAGAIDLAWNTPVPQPYHARPADPGTGLGHRLDPCLVFNPRGALRDVAVRRAIAYAVDKAAIAEAVAGLRTGTAIRVAGGVVPPNNDGHTGVDPYPTPGDRGDPHRARELLAAAGYADGLTLTAVHADTPEAAAVARSYAADLERVGITVALSQPEHREWDLTTLSLSPAWQHHNSRVFLQRLVHSLGHHAPEVDELMERAQDTIDPRPATAIWQQVEHRLMADVPVVPLLFQIPAVPGCHGTRVREAVAMPTLGYAYDLATLWLDAP